MSFLHASPPPLHLCLFPQLDNLFGHHIHVISPWSFKDTASKPREKLICVPSFVLHAHIHVSVFLRSVRKRSWYRFPKELTDISRCHTLPLSRLCGAGQLVFLCLLRLVFLCKYSTLVKSVPLHRLLGLHPILPHIFPTPQPILVSPLLLSLGPFLSLA